MKIIKNSIDNKISREKKILVLLTTKVVIHNFLNIV